MATEAPRPATYAGIFFVSLATLELELLLTRIFSVTMWYHFAFMAISMAMFGLTFGSVLVYVLPRVFTEERTDAHLSSLAAAFSLSIVGSFVAHTWIALESRETGAAFASVALTYAIASIPFTFAGACIALTLTRYASHVGSLYAADLAGAATGCLLLLPTLGTVDGPSAVGLVAALGGVGALAYAPAGEGGRRYRRLASLVVAFLVAGSAVHAFLARSGRPFVELSPARDKIEDQIEGRPLWERWNSFSRIRVTGDPEKASAPFGWALSPRYQATRPVRQLILNIDASAATPLTHWDGDASEVEHLRWDVTNVAHFLRRDARVLVVGAGGGRDVLSALAFGQRSVVAVEINQDIIRAVNDRFGEFTGHLDRRPGVSFVNDEARSWIARTSERFDVLQVSMIDTWAATTAGAYALTENSLYTIEGCSILLGALAKGGLLSYSRWYDRREPHEVYRLTALAAASLRARGVEHPERGIAIVVCLRAGPSVATLLASHEPFSDADLDALERASAERGFQLILSPRHGSPPLDRLATGRELDELERTLPVTVRPPTDESPFFFQMLRLSDALDGAKWRRWRDSPSMTANLTLAVLTGAVLALTLLCILLPLGLSRRRGQASSPPLLVYFCAIGAGFMLVEVSQMQRLIVLLGHPTYGLCVVLLALLLASGLGSALSRRLEPATALALLLGGLIVLGFATPPLVHGLEPAPIAVKIAVSVAVIAPVGVLMGMPFPHGMRLASRSERTAPLGPWLFGINGATSVCASVLAMAIAVGLGISASFWAGVASYALAALAFALERRREPAA